MDDVVPGTPGAADGRLITVGIPVFNGRSLLRSCLHSVISSGLPRERFEIVVADDGSREPETLAILADFSAKLADEPGFFRVLSAGHELRRRRAPAEPDPRRGDGRVRLLHRLRRHHRQPGPRTHRRGGHGGGARLGRAPPGARQRPRRRVHGAADAGRGVARQGAVDAHRAQGLPPGRDRAPAPPLRRGAPVGAGHQLRVLVPRERAALPHARRLRLLLPDAARRQPRRARAPLPAGQQPGGADREEPPDPRVDDHRPDAQPALRGRAAPGRLRRPAPPRAAAAALPRLDRERRPGGRREGAGRAGRAARRPAARGPRGGRAAEGLHPRAPGGHPWSGPAGAPPAHEAGRPRAEGPGRHRRALGGPGAPGHRRRRRAREPPPRGRGARGAAPLGPRAPEGPGAPEEELRTRG